MQIPLFSFFVSIVARFGGARHHLAEKNSVIRIYYAGGAVWHRRYKENDNGPL